MNARITPLRDGRQLALVQRPRRKMHVASIAAGDTTWLTFCDRDVPADGAQFWADDAAVIADDHADQMCAHCFRMVLVATYFAVRADMPRLARHTVEAKADAR